jgi:hypothetical protein
MRHIRDNERTILSGGRELFADQQEREGWGRLLDCLECCQTKGERLRFTSGYNGPQTWYKSWTERGDVTALYGTKARAMPEEAIAIGSATNTTINTTIGG